MPHIHTHHSLRHLNTFGIDARADYFVAVRTVEELQDVLREAQLRHLPRLILGGGSNVLFTRDRYEGLVIKIEITGLEEVRADHDHVWLQVGAGENWHGLVVQTIERGLSGIENLSLIPGTVGAAPMQNIGAYGVEIKEVFDTLVAVRLDDGTRRTFNAADCRFGYRNSVFKNELRGQYVIAAVTMRLRRKAAHNVTYGAIRDTLAEMGVAEPTLRDVSEAVIRIRRSKLPDPAQVGNAGSFFKNPELEPDDFTRLQADHPDIPHYPTDTHRIKVPAGWLIERAGWKGHREGNVGVHDRQALVLVNLGGARGDEVRALSEKIQASVRQRFGVALTPEVNFV